MVFSSAAFLFLFLPIVFGIYYLLQPRYRNLFLLVASLSFYAYGESKFVFVMIGVVFCDFLLGIWAEQRKNKNKSLGIILFLTVLINVGLLFVYKYLNFSLICLHAVLGDNVFVTNIALPIGISFFTFQAMSYVFDVCNGDAKAQTDFGNLLLYVCLFPQLVAGPIVRYKTVKDEIISRNSSYSDVYKGIGRFVFGLGKKAILANTFL